MGDGLRVDVSPALPPGTVALFPLDGGRLAMLVSAFPARSTLDFICGLRLSREDAAAVREQLLALGLRPIEIPVDGRRFDGEGTR